MCIPCIVVLVSFFGFSVVLTGTQMMWVSLVSLPLLGYGVYKLVKKLKKKCDSKTCWKL